MTTLLLVRHGENDWVKKHRLAGWIPGVYLNNNGHEQAKALAKRLATLPVTAIYSSPLERCMETAAHLAEPHALPITQLPQIGEVRYGEWEGKKIKKLAKRPEWFAVQHVPSRFAFPEGESMRGVQARAVDQIEALCRDHEDDLIIVVSHADVIKLVLAHYLGVHIDLFQRIGVSPASMSVLSLSKQGGVRVLRINDDGPLKPPAKREETKPDESKPESKQEEETHGNAH
jgi:probable phosphoglycerate mutase